MKSNIVYPNEVVAIVVTYNRLELLKQVVNGLINQTFKLSKIIIVNNSSTDGTADWLDNLSKKYLNITIITQENTGSSGGQCTGTKTAYEMGYEWIWVMDDDVMPAADCLKNLMLHCKPDLVCSPMRISYEGEILAEIDIAEINITNPFKGMWKRLLTKSEYLQAEVIPLAAVTFEGPIFHHSIFEKVGFPDKNFFIYGDDTEFSIRLKKCGIRFASIQKAVLNRLLPYHKEMPFDNWKFYYMIRNTTAIDTLHGNLPVRLFRSFGYVAKRLIKIKKLSHLKLLFRAYFDGYFYKQE